MTDDELFDRMRQVFEGRAGWHYEPSTTPGGLPSWYLDPWGWVTLSANVIDGTVTVYSPEEDRKVSVADVSAFPVWLDAIGDRYLAE